jgi:hypothetical protein
MSASARVREKLAARVGAGGTATVIGHPAKHGGGGIPDDVAAEVGGMLEETSSGSVAEVVKHFNAEHFVSVEGGRTSVYRETYDHELLRSRLDRMNKDAFHTLHGHKKITIFDSDGNPKEISVAVVWMGNSDRRTYLNGLALIPGGHTPAGVYNLWCGWPCEPKRGASLEDVRPVRVHLLKVICGDDRKAFDYLIGWLAWGIQNPDKQAEVAVVLQGGRGTGKGTLGRWFRDLYGAHGMHIQNPRHLTGNFNAHLQTCLAMFVDEAFFAGDRAGNAVLKALITEDQMTVEKKGIDVISVRNRLKIIMATNEEHAVIAGTDERRYFVLHVSNIKAQDHGYYAKLHAWWSQGGKEAFLGYLLDYDLTDFNIRAVPNTAALERQKIESLDVFNGWLFEKLVDGNWQQDRTPEHWASEFALYAEKHGGTRFVKTSTTAVGMRLREAGIRAEKTRQTKDDRKNVWVVPDLDEARRLFAEKLGLIHHVWDCLEQGDGNA